MATVTEDIVSNLLKSNLKDLKSFAEMLNAEFTEEGHGNWQCRLSRRANELITFIYEINSVNFQKKK